MQSVSTVQLVLHAVAPHRYGVHAYVTGAGHAPVPPHDAAAVWVPAAQLAARQLVVAPGYAHAVALEPLQLPPQALPSLAQAVRVPCGAPLDTVAHVPTLPAMSQAWHWPVQALLQHTPSTQLFPAHSELAAHAVPRSFRNVATTL